MVGGDHRSHMFWDIASEAAGLLGGGSPRQGHCTTSLHLHSQRYTMVHYGAMVLAACRFGRGGGGVGLCKPIRLG